MMTGFLQLMKYTPKWLFLITLLICTCSCKSNNGRISLVSESKAAEDVRDLSAKDRQSYKDILSDIEQFGDARVIVELKTGENGNITPAAISSVQDQLLQQLSSYHFKLLRRYSVLPMLALGVDKASLEFLIGSPLVKSINADEQRHKQQQ